MENDTHLLPSTKILLIDRNILMIVSMTTMAKRALMHMVDLL